MDCSGCDNDDDEVGDYDERKKQIKMQKSPLFNANEREEPQKANMIMITNAMSNVNQSGRWQQEEFAII